MTIKVKNWSIAPIPRIFAGNGFPNINFGEGYTGSLGEIQGSVTYDPYEMPDYRRRIRDGRQATTTMTGNVPDYSPGECIFRSKMIDNISQTEWVTDVHGDAGVYLYTPADPTDLSEVDADNSAVMKLQQIALQKQRQFQTGVFLGELAESIKTIANPVRSIFELTVDYLSNVKKDAKRRRRKRKDMKHMVANKWLEYSFGIVPLLSDIQNAADAAAKIVTYRMPREVVIGKGQSSFSSLPFESGLDMSVWKLVVKMKYTNMVQVKYKALVKTSNSTRQDDLDSLGISWGNFVPTLWELIPFSFLVDYFTNVGSVLDSLAVNTNRVEWVERNVHKTIACEATSVDAIPNSTMPYPGYSGGWTAQTPGPMPRITRSVFDRRSVYGLPTPTLRFKVPFDKPIKNANLVALAVANSEALLSVKASTY